MIPTLKSQAPLCASHKCPWGFFIFLWKRFLIVSKECKPICFLRNNATGALEGGGNRQVLPGEFQGSLGDLIQQTGCQAVISLSQLTATASSSTPFYSDAKYPAKGIRASPRRSWDVGRHTGARLCAHTAMVLCLKQRGSGPIWRMLWQHPHKVIRHAPRPISVFYQLLKSINFSSPEARW